MLLLFSLVSPLANAILMPSPRVFNPAYEYSTENTNDGGVESMLKGYMSYKDLTNIPSSSLPQVIEIPVIGSQNDMNDQILIDTTDMTIVPIYTVSKEETTYGYTVESSNEYKPDGALLSDGKTTTYEDFPATTTSTPTVIRIYIKPDVVPAVPKVSGIELVFDQFSKRPDSIEMSTLMVSLDEEVYSLIAKSPYSSDVIRFPASVANGYGIKLYHSQPLRISDVKVITDTPFSGGTAISYSVRFTALTGHSYRLYFSKDKYVSYNESPEIAYSLANPVGNAITKIDVESLPTIPNSTYASPDQDNDGIPTISDNCPKVANTDQKDDNTNGVGDACDDFDQDGVYNAVDNCKVIPNQYQEDKDGDGMGDACDSEESRYSERYPWLPWLGIIVGFGVTGGVLMVSLKQHAHIKNDKESTL